MTISQRRFTELLADRMTDEQQRFYVHMFDVGRKDEVAPELDFDKTAEENIEIYLDRLDRLIEKERQVGHEDAALIDQIMRDIELARENGQKP